MKKIDSFTELLAVIKTAVKVKLGNELICFTKWFLGAKRIQITYGK